MRVADRYGLISVEPQVDLKMVMAHVRDVITSAIHVYPTYSTASMQATVAIRVEQMLSGASGQVIRGLAWLIR